MTKISNTALLFGIIIAGIIVGLGSTVFSAGFVSFENGDTFIFWDDVRVGPTRADGSDSIYCVDGIGENEQDCLSTGGEWRPYSGVIVGKGDTVPLSLAQPGNIIVEGKNIYVMGAIAQCDNYQEGTLVDQVNCSTVIKSMRDAAKKPIASLITPSLISKDITGINVHSDGNIILDASTGVQVFGELEILNEGALIVGFGAEAFDSGDVFAQRIDAEELHIFSSDESMGADVPILGGGTGTSVNGYLLLPEDNTQRIKFLGR